MARGECPFGVCGVRALPCAVLARSWLPGRGLGRVRGCTGRSGPLKPSQQRVHGEPWAEYGRNTSPTRSGQPHTGEPDTPSATPAHSTPPANPHRAREQPHSSPPQAAGPPPAHPKNRTNTRHKQKTVPTTAPHHDPAVRPPDTRSHPEIHTPPNGHRSTAPALPQARPLNSPAARPKRSPATAPANPTPNHPNAAPEEATQRHPKPNYYAPHTPLLPTSHTHPTRRTHPHYW